MYANFASANYEVSWFDDAGKDEHAYLWSLQFDQYRARYYLEEKQCLNFFGT